MIKTKDILAGTIHEDFISRASSVGSGYSEFDSYQNQNTSIQRNGSSSSPLIHIQRIRSQSAGL